MKIFLAIPHFIKRQVAEGQENSEHLFASHTQDPAKRIPNFFKALRSFVTMFPERNIELMYTGLVGGSSAARSRQADSMDVAICTLGDNHIIDLLPAGLPKNVRQVSVDCDPMHLGFECHKQMLKAYKEGDYDFFVYAEDDIALFDRDLFHKLAWFEQAFGEECLLNPNRYETPFSWQKIYIDGAVPPALFNGAVWDSTEAIFGSYGAQKIEFVRHANPMSGCFFLTRKQMGRLVNEPSFGTPSDEILSYLETAQILPLLRQFKVYKPTLRNAAFAEVQHTGIRLTLTKTSSRTLMKAMA